jgi:hypothetical protein
LFSSLELGIPLASGSSQKTKTSMSMGSQPWVYYIFVVGMFIIGVYFLYDAIQAYTVGDIESAGFSALLGIIGIGMSIYMVTMLRKRILTQKTPKKVVTTIECKKCGLKKIRPFMKGDYVLKAVEHCAKCNEPMAITAIYAEKTDKS